MGSTKLAMIGHKRIPSREGGIEVVVEELATRLLKYGYQISVYNRSGTHVSGAEFGEDRGIHSMKIYRGLQLIRIPTLKYPGFNAVVYSVLATIHAILHRCDCIHYHGMGSCAIAFLPKMFGIRIVATIHGLDWKRGKWGGFASKYLRFGEKMAVKYADEIIVLSKNMELYFKEEYGRKIHVISNGIMPMERKNVELIREKWRLEKEEYILYLGRIVPEKKVHELIQAFSALDTTKKLVIAGGSSNTESYFNQIKEQAKKEDRIIFTNFVEGDILRELYSNAYIYVLPSEVEGMPLSLLEAMSFGNCCLVSNIPECVEVVKEQGVIFEQGNLTDLKQKLSWLLSHPDEVQGMRETSRDFVCKTYNWDQVVEMTQELYKDRSGSVYESSYGK